MNLSPEEKEKITNAALRFAITFRSNPKQLYTTDSPLCGSSYRGIRDKNDVWVVDIDRTILVRFPNLIHRTCPACHQEIVS